MQVGNILGAGTWFPESREPLLAQALQDLYGVPRKLVRTDDRTRRAKEKAAAKAKAKVVREKKAEKARQ